MDHIVTIICFMITENADFIVKGNLSTLQRQTNKETDLLA